jgi:hypothetical protein
MNELTEAIALFTNSQDIDEAEEFTVTLIGKLVRIIHLGSIEVNKDKEDIKKLKCRGKCANKTLGEKAIIKAVWLERDTDYFVTFRAVLIIKLINEKCNYCNNEYLIDVNEVEQVEEIKKLTVEDLSLGQLIEQYEFYPTPAEVTQILLKKEEFVGNIWEPACGDGAIVDVLSKHFGRGRILASDIYDYGFEGTFQWDFLAPRNDIVDNIITGPPYRKKDKFVEQALKVARKKVAMLLPKDSMSTKKRLNWNCRHIWVGDVTYFKGTEFQPNSPVSSCWYVWDKEKQ